MSGATVVHGGGAAHAHRHRWRWAITPLVIAACFGGLEAYVRTARLLDYPPILYRLSDTRGWEFRPGAHASTPYGHEVRINTRGLRDREFAVPKPKGTYRLLMLGDSYVFGAGVAAEDSLPKQLERRLGSARVEVLNAGVPGYGTYQERVLLREVGLSYDPDAVLIGFYHNDLKPYTARPPSPLRRVVWAVRPHVYAYDYVQTLRRRTAQTLAPAAEQSPEAALAEFWDGARAELAATVALGADRDIPVGIVYVGLQRAPGVGARVETWCREARVPYFDVRAAYGQEDLTGLQLGPTDGHPTPEAIAQAAEGLAAFLRRAPALRAPQAFRPGVGDVEDGRA